MAPIRPSIMSDGRHDVAAGGGQAFGLADQGRDRLVVEDHAVAQEAVLAVAGVGVERHVADHAEIGAVPLDRADRPAHQIVVVPGLARHPRSCGRAASPETAPRPGCPAPAARSATGSSRSTDSRSMPGHGGDRLPLALAVEDEQRLDQVGGCQPVLGHQAPAPAVLTQPAQRVRGIGCWRHEVPGLAHRRPPEAGHWRCMSGCSIGATGRTQCAPGKAVSCGLTPLRAVATSMAAVPGSPTHGVRPDAVSAYDRAFIGYAAALSLASCMTEPGQEIRFERRGALGIVILDRPQALNALTWGMVRELSRWLAVWRDDPKIAAVLVKAAPGRAFCAGGDIRAVDRSRPSGRHCRRDPVLSRRVPAQLADPHLPQALYVAARRHHHGRRGRHLGAWRLSGGHREHAAGHAGDRDRLLPRCRRHLVPAALPRRDRHVSRAHRCATEWRGLPATPAWPPMPYRPHAWKSSRRRCPESSNPAIRMPS